MAGAKQEDPNCFLGGNFGYPVADYISDVLEQKRKRCKIAIIEISSYQLENCKGLFFDASIITSLNENHLERYARLDHYYLTKLSLVFRTRGHIILNENGHDLFPYMNKLIAHFPDGGLVLSRPLESAEIALDRILLGFSRSEEPLDFNDLRQILGASLRTHDQNKTIHWAASKPTDHCEMVGSHNRDNFALALCLGKLLAFKPQSLNALRSFRGLPHRIENLGLADGIRFINDSKSTTIESVIVAIESCRDFSRSGTLFVLLGGRDKNLPWTKLQKFQESPNMKFVFFGESAEFASQETRLSKNIHKSLGAALAWCETKAQWGDTILLSPGGSSLDEFKNFEARGVFFRSKMLDIASRKGDGP
jgi:UDP-N-acetylmuramoylalanine--D-glutamate ligase